MCFEILQDENDFCGLLSYLLMGFDKDLSYRSDGVAKRAARLLCCKPQLQSATLLKPACLTLGFRVQGFGRFRPMD